MMSVQGLEFDEGSVIVSVGFFLAKDFKELKKTRPKYIEVYEPLPRAFKLYEEAIKGFPAVHPFQKAVAGANGSAFLKGKSSRSTIMDMNKKVDSKYVHSVKVVSMSSILERVSNQFGGIDDLLLNCEGAEIDIIKRTHPLLFMECKRIFIQFHDFIPTLDMRKKDVQDCIKRLAPYFEVEVVQQRYSKYIFTRK